MRFKHSHTRFLFHVRVWKLNVISGMVTWKYFTAAVPQIVRKSWCCCKVMKWPSSFCLHACGRFSFALESWGMRCVGHAGIWGLCVLMLTWRWNSQRDKTIVLQKPFISVNVTQNNKVTTRDSIEKANKFRSNPVSVLFFS